MFSYFKRRRVQRKALKEKALKDSKMKAMANLALETAHMTSKPCAINEFKNCDKNCVHFENGQVDLVWLEPRYYNTEPRCKLW